MRKKFDGAGITVYAYNYSLNVRFTDAEINRGFEIAKALGAEVITASTTLDVGEEDRAVRREAPDGRGDAQPLEHQRSERVRDAESFAAAMKMSKYFKVNLDIGHFTAANYDARRLSSRSTTPASRTST